MSKTLTISEAKARLSELVADVEKTEVELVITRNGRPAAVLISAEEFHSWKETKEIKSQPALMNDCVLGIARRVQNPDPRPATRDLRRQFGPIHAARKHNIGKQHIDAR